MIGMFSGYPIKKAGLSVSRQPGYLDETRSFLPPSRGGFGFFWRMKRKFLIDVYYLHTFKANFMPNYSITVKKLPTCVNCLHNQANENLYLNGMDEQFSPWILKNVDKCKLFRHPYIFYREVIIVTIGKKMRSEKIILV